MATSDRRRLSRSLPAVAPRPPLRIAAAGASRVARRAGTRPNSTHVVTASAAVNASTRPSTPRPTKSGLSAVLRNATSPRLSAWASATPSAAPATASNRLSARNWRTNRQREAPIASLTATSCSRALARASSRLARFVHAISSTRPVVASSSQSGFSYCRRKPETPVPAGAATSLLAR